MTEVHFIVPELSARQVRGVSTVSLNDVQNTEANDNNNNYNNNKLAFFLFTMRMQQANPAVVKIPW